MPDKQLKLVVLGLTVGVASSLGTLQLFGQDLRQRAEDIPLTYTRTFWQSVSLERDESESEERFMSGARRGDGSTVRVWHERTDDGTPFEVRFVEDLERGRSMLIDTLVSSVTTAALNEQQIRARRNRAACRGETVSTVLGYDVIRDTGSPAPLQGHDLRVEVLVAPALGCLEMEKRTVVTYDDGTERTVGLERVVDVQPGEPPSSWFEVPSGYTEVSPLERLSAVNARKGAEAQLSDEQLANDPFVLQAERRYQERRPR